MADRRAACYPGGMTRIQTVRLILRDWRDEDRSAYAAIDADPIVMEHLGGVQTRAQSDAGIDRQIARATRGEPCFWAAEQRDDGALIGFIGVKRIDFDAPFAPGHEIGWRLGAAYWGQGLASEGARAALTYTFEAFGLSEIFAITVPANLRSQAVMRRIGMTRVEGGDFDHPLLHEGDPLRRHILYRIARPGG